MGGIVTIPNIFLLMAGGHVVPLLSLCDFLFQCFLFFLFTPTPNDFVHFGDIVSSHLDLYLHFYHHSRNNAYFYAIIFSKIMSG